MRDRNIFAYTAPGSSFPDYLSINRRDGEIVVTVRGGQGGNLAEMVLPQAELDALIYALRGYLDPLQAEAADEIIKYRRLYEAESAEVQSLNRRGDELTLALREMREQLIKARDALGRGHGLEVECSRHIGRAWNVLNFGGNLDGCLSLSSKEQL